MSKHTPGPWYVGTDYGDQCRHIYANKKVRDADGDEWNPLIAVTDDDETLVNWEANARLIAAAPELLEALKGMLCWPNTPSPETVRKAQAAFAKAIGDTNE